jgi:serine/threonine-protein kinase HipA
MADVSVLEVLLHGTPIGTLTRVDGERVLFTFDDTYVADPDRPVLGLGFKDRFGGLITEFRPTQTRLLPFFSNLLPEGRMRTYLAERAGVNPTREFFLLRALGRDLPGAVTVRPVEGASWPGEAPVEDDANVGMDDGEKAFRFSLAGVQLKFSAIHDAQGGLTIPARGVGGAWIVKLPSSQFRGVPENEASMLTLARLLGIDVPAVRLVDIGSIANLPGGIGAFGGQALAIERFDRRSDGGTVHVEDFAQVFGIYPEEKYRKGNARNIAHVVGAEGTRQDIAEFVRRLTFSMLIGNADMHMKNWSLIYPDRRNASLAPAYDFVSTVAYIPDTGAALNVSRTRRFDAFDEDELAHLAAKALLPRRLVVETARETVALFHQHWSAEKWHLPLGSAAVEAIDRHLATVPIARGRPAG